MFFRILYWYKEDYWNNNRLGFKYDGLCVFVKNFLIYMIVIYCLVYRLELGGLRMLLKELIVNCMIGLWYCLYYFYKKSFK